MNLGDESPWDDVPTRSTSERDKPGGTESTEGSTPQTTATTISPNTSSTARGRAARGPRRIVPTQSTKLEAVDNTLDPLGPLGNSSEVLTTSDEPPELPRKEQATSRVSRPSTAGSETSPNQSKISRQTHDENENENSPRSRTSPPLQSPSRDNLRQQPRTTIESVPKPTFHISVGDPHKVGDLTSSHTVYQVRTKTSSKAYRSPEFEVSRRYKDFLWLYNQLHNDNPGIIVPPPPEKQTVGRFDANFVESRRAALERMLNKTAAHPILQHDGDLKLFLESDAFNADVRQRERKDPDLNDGKGMFGGLGLSVGSGTKFIEQDEWFLDRRVYLDNLEAQLKALLKSTDTAVAQRKALADACGELSGSLNTLSQVELSPFLTGPLAGLSDLHLRIRDLYDRQAQQDVLTLGIVIDEYIRLIGSIKKAFEQRQKAWQNWHTAESDLQKRKSSLDKLMRSGRTQQDKMSQLQADVADAERRSHQARLLFEDLGRGMRGELERFEREKVEDFRMGVETYLESSVEAQKELIEIWETYLMHLDADEEANVDPKASNLPADQGNISSTTVEPSHEHGSLFNDGEGTLTASTATAAGVENEV